MVHGDDDKTLAALSEHPLPIRTHLAPPVSASGGYKPSVTPPKHISPTYSANRYHEQQVSFT